MRLGLRTSASLRARSGSFGLSIQPVTSVAGYLCPRSHRQRSTTTRQMHPHAPAINQTSAAGHVHCQGKGRKHRCTPLRPETAKMLDAWLRHRRGRPEDPLFLSARGEKLIRDAIERLITKYTALAARTCASLKRKKVSPHVPRHAPAMDLLQNGVDRSVIALWLGHESVDNANVSARRHAAERESTVTQEALEGSPRTISAD